MNYSFSFSYFLETASAYPSVDAILEHLKNTTSTRIKKMIDLPAFGEDGARYKELVTALSTNDKN